MARFRVVWVNKGKKDAVVNGVAFPIGKKVTTADNYTTDDLKRDLEKFGIVKVGVIDSEEKATPKTSSANPDTQEKPGKAKETAVKTK